jgi:hypothetical protein
MWMGLLSKTPALHFDQRKSSFIHCYKNITEALLSVIVSYSIILLYIGNYLAIEQFYDFFHFIDEETESHSI